jgi:hypothetical protein
MKKSLGYSNPEASFNKVKRNDLYSDLPKVKFPLINTMIKNHSKIKFIISDKERAVIKINTDDIDNYKIDKSKQVVVFPDGREFILNSLTNLNSRTGKSIEKSDAVELANTYLKLGIPSKSKKNIFIKAIREKLKLEPIELD